MWTKLLITGAYALWFLGESTQASRLPFHDLFGFGMSLQSVLTALGGGILIGLSATIFLLLNGRIAGISNIVAGLWRPERGDIWWRLCFILGLMAGGSTLAIFHPDAFGEIPSHSFGVLSLAGFLVGYGARTANGCTSGHGVCGLSRRSLRSLMATGTFILTGIATVYLVNHVFLQPR